MEGARKLQGEVETFEGRDDFAMVERFLDCCAKVDEKKNRVALYRQHLATFMLNLAADRMTRKTQTKSIRSSIPKAVKRYPEGSSVSNSSSDLAPQSKKKRTESQLGKSSRSTCIKGWSAGRWEQEEKEPPSRVLNGAEVDNLMHFPLLTEGIRKEYLRAQEAEVWKSE
ncbi:hypothetical protein AC1031_010918 [Aphanomyces cochlioides]|nr:hypothetical protein AC1031_010918 [Aphanomyces cochlioides]